MGRRERVRLPLRALRVDVDEAHGDGAEVALELERAVGAVALVAEPGVLRTPEDLLGLPYILAAEGEAEGLEAHVLVGHVAGEHQQVSPGQAAAVLLLDRQQQAAGLVQVAVVRPAVERGEALGAVTGTAAAVELAVGAGGVPRHADEQRAVVAPVGGPPVLRRAHDLDEVGFDRLEVQLGDGPLVVEVLAERVGLARGPVENLQVDLVRPPVAVGPRPGVTVEAGTLEGRVLTLARARRAVGALRARGLLARLRVGQGRVLTLGHFGPSSDGRRSRRPTGLVVGRVGFVEGARQRPVGGDWQAGHRPQYTTSASSIVKPAPSDAVKQGVSPMAQSTSRTAPQERHTRW